MYFNRGDLEGMSLPVDASLVLTSDPKPRLRWTSELHDRFIDAVTQLGGPEKATPKTILRIMNIKGLTLYHLKSHLQKFRMGKQSKDLENSNDVSGAVESQASTCAASKQATQEFNDGCNEAMRVQMELQRRLHEQLEVERSLQQRIEAQGKYLESILERACRAVVDPNHAASEMESSRNRSPELANGEIIHGCVGFSAEPLPPPQLPFLLERAGGSCGGEEKCGDQGVVQQMNECSVESCLTFNSSAGSKMGLKKRPRPMLFGGVHENEPWTCSM